MSDTERSVHFDDGTVVVETDIPGLWDVTFPDGGQLFDLTVGQVQSVAGRAMLGKWAVSGVQEGTTDE